jgi:hypothetical protein
MEILIAEKLITSKRFLKNSLVKNINSLSLKLK